ncbi:HsdM family class I SAM-dependent methyltransferase [Priestia megaterium]
MGRKERKRYEDNSSVKELLDKEYHTQEEIEFIKNAYTGIGGLSPTGFNNGQFFTPTEVAVFTRMMMGIEGGRVLEPSCGGGAFINVLPESCSVYGSEMMIEASRVSEICYPHATIRQGNALTMDWDEPFDYVIGNPPYGLKVDEWNFNCGKKLKSEVAFIEYGMKWLKPGGILGMIVPDSILANQREQPFRKHMLDNNELLAVVSLPPETFYHTGTSVKTSLLMVRKGRSTNEDYSVFMAMCTNVGWDKRGNRSENSDLPSIYRTYLDSGISHLRQHEYTPKLVESTGVKTISGQLALDIF